MEPKDLIERMPLVTKDFVGQYLVDQSWTLMKPIIQAQMTKAYEASADLFVGSDENMMVNYLFFMSPDMVEYIAKIIEKPRTNKNPVRIIKLYETAKESLSKYFDTSNPDELNEWSKLVLTWILLAYVYRRVRGQYYASLMEPPLQETSEDFLMTAFEFIVPDLIPIVELKRVYGKALQKVQSELEWAQRKVAADRTKVVGQIGEAGIAANQAKVRAIKEGKAGGRRRTRRLVGGRRRTRRLYSRSH